MLHSGKIYVVTLVLSEKKFWTKQKTITPLPCKLNVYYIKNLVCQLKKLKQSFGVPINVKHSYNLCYNLIDMKNTTQSVLSTWME